MVNVIGALSLKWYHTCEIKSFRNPFLFYFQTFFRLRNFQILIFKSDCYIFIFIFYSNRLNLIFELSIYSNIINASILNCAANVKLCCWFFFCFICSTHEMFAQCVYALNMVCHTNFIYHRKSLTESKPLTQSVRNTLWHDLFSRYCRLNVNKLIFHMKIPHGKTLIS